MFILLFVLLFSIFDKFPLYTFIEFNRERSKAFINCLEEGGKRKAVNKKKKERKGNKGNRLLCVAPAYMVYILM